MAAKVVWRADRQRWYLVDHHPSHPGGRRVVALGTTDGDRARGERVAEGINQERAQAGRAAATLSAHGPIRGSAALEAWWAVARPGMAESTRATVPFLLRHLERHFGATNLRKLGREQVRAFGAAMADAGLSQSTVADTLSVLRRVLNWCIEEPQAYLAKAPVPNLVALGVKAAAARGARTPERVPFTYEEADTLLELARAHRGLWLALLLARHTGARKGELLALRWSRVNFARARITFAESRSRKAKRAKSTKTNRIRETQVADELIQELRRVAFDRFGGDAFRLDIDQPVLLNSKGRPWDETALDSAWTRLRRRALPHGVRPLPFHAWRHTYVSWALAAGQNPVWVAEQIGDTIETLLRHYAHLVPGQAGDLSFVSRQRSSAPDAPPRDPPGESAAGGAPSIDLAERRDRRTSRRTSARPGGGSSSASRSSRPRGRRT